MSATRRTRAKHVAWVLMLTLWSAGILLIAVAQGLITGLRHLPLPGLPVLLLFMILAMPAAVSLHELGHLLCGMAAGFAPRLYIVGPLKIEWVDGRAHAGFSSDMRYFGGLAAVIPHPAPNLPRKIALMIAGGPLANALVALLTLPSALFLTARGFSRAGFILFLFGLFAACVGLGSLIPIRSSNLPSDGLRLLRTWQGGPQVARDAAMLAASAQIMTDTRPRELSPALLDAILAIDDQSPERALAEALAFAVNLDQGDLAGATTHLARAMALRTLIGPTFLPAYCLDCAYMAARYEQNPEQARKWLAQSKGGLGIEPAARLRAESAVVLAEGDRERAAALARQGLALLANRQMTGYLNMERDLLQELENEAARAAAL